MSVIIMSYIVQKEGMLCGIGDTEEIRRGVPLENKISLEDIVR